MGGGEEPPITRLRTPGYPYYLAAIRSAFGSDLLWAVIGQCLLGSLTCVLIAWLADTLNYKLGLLASQLPGRSKYVTKRSKEATSSNVNKVSVMISAEKQIMLTLTAESRPASKPSL